MKSNNPLKFRWLHGEDAKKIPRSVVVVRRIRAVTEKLGRPAVTTRGVFYDVINNFNSMYVESPSGGGTYGVSQPNMVGGQVFSYMWIKDKA